MSYREEWFKHNKSDHGWYTCARCGKKIRKEDADIDHIVPQKYGGSDRLFNLQCLCKHCNRSKQASMRDTVPDLLKTNSIQVWRAALSLLPRSLSAVRSNDGCDCPFFLLTKIFSGKYNCCVITV